MTRRTLSKSSDRSLPKTSPPALPDDLASRVTADCTRCAGLCCIVDHFDAGPDFGHTKPAFTRCTHLDATNRCGIHADLAATGYTGCTAFDCHGAGPAVMAHVPQGQPKPETIAPLYHRLLRLHQSAAHVAAARALPLSEAQRTVATDLLTRALAPGAPPDEPTVEALIVEMTAFLQSLRPLACPPRSP